MEWDSPPPETWKGRIDPVSVADKDAEHAAISVLKRSFPQDLIVSEESSPLPEPHVAGRRRWYLDPLDGTVNFLRRRPHWCVSLALVDENDEASCAAVFDPNADELFLAVRGHGATLNGVPLQAPDPGALDRAVVGSGFPYSFEDPQRANLQEWSSVTTKALSMRSLGACALDLCDVARGRLDAFWELQVERWDTTAGALVAREAGALTTSISGAPILGATTEVLCAGPRLHAELVSALRPADTSAKRH